ncbi:hypothetical protein J6590_015924 [Homalodisca vitripennis]|nr:hypothetical protein J6590_015924 [Homalodisca vitripennis]
MNLLNIQYVSLPSRLKSMVVGCPKEEEHQLMEENTCLAGKSAFMGVCKKLLSMQHEAIAASTGGT